MNKKIITYAGASLIAAVSVFVLSGCQSRSMSAVSADSSKRLNNEVQYQRHTAQQSSPLYTLMNKPVTARFSDVSIYQAMKKVARQVGVPVDNVFIPSSTYKVTMNVKTTLGDFIDSAYRQTGVEYKYRSGMLKIFNPKVVERYTKVKSCGKRSPTVRVSLTNVPPMVVFKHFSDNYGYSFTFDTKYITLNSAVSGGKKGVGGARPVSFFYKGCDPREALMKFVQATDLKVEFGKSKKATIRDYETVSLEIPSYFDTKFESGGASVGSGGESGGGESSAEGAKLSMSEDFRAEFTKYIKSHLNKRGTVYVSNRGYVTVTDRPSRIREVRKLVQKEVKAQQPIELDVSVIRIDVSDDYASGVDWNFALKEIGNSLGVANLTMGLNYAGMVQGGLSLGGIANGEQQLVKLLGKYGNAKIARDYNTKTRSGILNTFRAVQEIPYITTTVVQSNATSEIGTEARVAVAGLIINIIPTFAKNNEVINLATDITISEYLGDKTFNVNGGEISLPRIATNKVQMAAVVHTGETMILTGFKLRNGSKDGEGVPHAINQDVIGNLFGKKESSSNVSEFLVIVTPKKTRSY